MAAIQSFIFDAFGTLVHITRPTSPLRRLATSGSQRLQQHPMTNPLGIVEMAQSLGTPITPDKLASIEHELYAELASIRLYPDTLATLQAVRAWGGKIIVASNLAAPYGVAVRLLLTELVDDFVFSYEIGAKKPEPAFYATVCDTAACQPDQCIMIGNSYRSDYLGATAYGLRALFLARDSASVPTSLTTGSIITNLTDIQTFLGSA